MNKDDMVKLLNDRLDELTKTIVEHLKAFDNDRLDVNGLMRISGRISELDFLLSKLVGQSP
jgi:hypothetical protein